MISGDNGCESEIVKVDARAWHEIIQRFDDNNIYQTWSLDALRRGEGRLSHLLLKRQSRVIAAAQVVIMDIPVLGAGIAHVKFGPLWQIAGQQPEPENYRLMLRALHAEYAERRGLVLRVKPWEAGELAATMRSVRAQEGMTQPGIAPYRTFVIDLSNSIDALYGMLTRKWRQELKQTTRHDLSVREMAAADGMDLLVRMYRDMAGRKGFADFTDIDLLRRASALLPESLMPRVVVCEQGNEPLAAIAYSTLGNRTLALFGATSHRGRELGASYCLNWSMITRLQASGTCRWYDLVGGLDDPGVRHFKSGLVGKSLSPVEMYDFDIGGSLTSRAIVDVGERARVARRSLVVMVSRGRQALREKFKRPTGRRPR